MSVTFHSNVADKTTKEQATPCLCSQMADSFCAAMNGDFSDGVKADLKANADPACSWCKGSGVETQQESDAPSTSASSRHLLKRLLLVGLPPSPGNNVK